MPKLVALPIRGYTDIYVNPTRVTLIRESGEAETLVEFAGDKREAISLPIATVRTWIHQAMWTVATPPFAASPRLSPAVRQCSSSDEPIKSAGRYCYER